MKRLIFAAVVLTAAVTSANVLAPVGVAPQVLIPAAGSTPGANGTFFHSDISIENFAAHDQQVTLQWLPQMDSGAVAVTNTIKVPAGSGIRSDDFVHDYLGVSGLGSIIVSGVTSTGAPDLAAQLYVTSRIWTQQPGSAGTTSQSFDAIPMSVINTPAAAVLGMGDPANPRNFRENVGIVNVDPGNAQTFVIAVNNLGVGPQPLQTVITIPPMSMQQVSFGSGFGALIVPQVTITNVTESATRSNLWTAYSSTIDDVTGDAWSDLAAPVGVAPQVLIPAAGSTPGANGTFFRSDITIVNFAPHEQQVGLQWLPQAGSGAAGVTKTITIPARFGLRSSEFVHDYLGVSGLGSIIVSGVTSTGAPDSNASLYVASRIWSPQPGTNGTTSQSFDAIPTNAINTASETLVGLGAVTNAGDYRVNIGIVNMNQVAVTFSIHVPGPAGILPPLPPIDVTVPPMSMQQVSLGSGLGNAMINVTTAAPSILANRWIAYSSTIDNISGDAWSELGVVSVPSPNP